jgi:tungstate transport system substrate-binding protein
MDAGIVINTARDRWYREIGQGMGAALNVAASTDSYLLAGRGIWLSFRNRGTLVILVEGIADYSTGMGSCSSILQNT